MRRLCNIVKPLSDFHVNNSNADKHDTRCKTCCQGYEKEKRAKKHRILEPTVAEKTCRCVLVLCKLMWPQGRGASGQVIVIVAQ